MSDNTIFQGTPPPVVGQPPVAPPLIPSQPIPVTPAQQAVPVPPIAVQQTPSINTVPQPIQQPIIVAPPQQPVAVSSVTPPPPPPPMTMSHASSTAMPPPGGSSGSFFSRLPLGGIMKAVIGVVLLGIIAIVIFTFVMPMFASKSDEKVTLTYWGLWEDPRVMQAIINDFQKEHPNITVKYEPQEVKEYRDRLETRFKNGNGPDLFRFHNSWLPQINGIVAPLPSDVISPDEFKKSYYPVMQNDLTKNGAIYGIPLQIDTLALFTNTDMFEAASLTPPTNWEDFGKDARILTVKDEEGKIKTAGAALGTFDNITHAPDILSLLFMQNGADMYDFSKTPQAASDTLSYYTEYASGDSNVWDETLDPSLLAFSKGNLAMYIGYSWDIFTIKAINPELKFQVTAIPHLPLGRKNTIASYWVEGVSQKTKHQKEAMLFMNYLTKKTTLEKMFSEASKTRPFGELYPRTDMAESLKDNPTIYPFVQQSKDAVSSFFASDTYDNGLNEKANTYLGKAVDAILKNNTSPESALEALTAGVAQVLEKYGSN